MNTRIGIITAPRKGCCNTIDATIRTMRAQDAFANDKIYGVFSDAIEPPDFSPEVQPLIEHVEMRTVRDLHWLKSTPNVVRLIQNALTGRVLRRDLKRTFRSPFKTAPYFGTDNLARAFTWASQADIAVVSEDDLLMSSQWLSRAIEMVRIAQNSGIEHPVVCLSHAYYSLERFGDVIAWNLDDDSALYGWTRDTWPNGMSPIVTTGQAARLIAATLAYAPQDMEPDVAIFWACRDLGIATGGYTDPCFAMHMDFGSTYMPDRPPVLAVTKRYRPF